VVPTGENSPIAAHRLAFNEKNKTAFAMVSFHE
jgi:hypothetical protein